MWRGVLGLAASERREGQSQPPAWVGSLGEAASARATAIW